MFFPRGLAGRLCWIAVLPFHGFISAGMARRIVAVAESRDRGSRAPGRPPREPRT